MAKGNLTLQQAAQLSNYAGRVLNSEINDVSYRDNDNSSTDVVASTLLSVQEDSADMVQFLGMSQDDLIAELQAGKSLGAIAMNKGISGDKLVAKLQEGLVAELKRIIWGSGSATAASAAEPTNTPTDALAP